MLQGDPKIKKRRTLKHRVLEFNDYHGNYLHDDQRSVCSEGNSPSKIYPDIDISPFEMLEEFHSYPLNNSLERLFSDNKELSDISSVKQQSQNSGFFNSRSELAGMFEKT